MTNSKLHNYAVQVRFTRKSTGKTGGKCYQGVDATSKLDAVKRVTENYVRDGITAEFDFEVLGVERCNSK